MKNSQSSAKKHPGTIKSFLSGFGQTDRVLILIKPDPDSMASALAVKRLLWRHVDGAWLGYIGEIQRPDNQAMRDLLKIQMNSLDELAPDDFSRFVLVDSQPDHSEAFSHFQYDAIIDHHPETKKWNAPYVDIRPEYGATATIMSEYLRLARIRPSIKLATALLFGIKADTANFERHATVQDMEAFCYLFKFANLYLLQKIELSDLRERDLKHFQTALKERTLSGRRMYAHLGLISNPDICVQIADFFMRVLEAEWSIISAVCDEELTIVLRSDGQKKDAGKLASQAFGKRGLAGGHRGAARANIPLTSLREIGVRNYELFVKQQLNL
jgi:nanoRNase/pAp phosphatase (c-di-AMP/oligoRNAs hydrolase)